MTSREHPTPELDVPELTPGSRRLLEVASQLFYERGIHAVGVDTIASQSGVTKRTLYDRFASKDNLVAVYLHTRHQAWWQQLDQRLAVAEKPKVLALFDAYAEDLLPLERGCAFLNAAAELPRDHPGYRVVQQHKQAVRQRLEELLRDEVAAIEDVQTTADHLFLLLEGAIAHRGIDTTADLTRQARRIAEQVLAQSTAAPKSG